MASEITNNTWAEPFIVTTDMGIDDNLALLYLINKVSIQLNAIAVSGAGLAHLQQGIHHLEYLLKLSEKNIPIGFGRTSPLKGTHAFPEEWRKETDELFESKETVCRYKPATEIISETLSASVEKVNILSLGPLTDLAEVLQKNPQLTQKIKMIYIMGGAFQVGGNLSEETDSKNKVSEYNIYVDYEAAYQVLHSKAPITFISLDTTNQAPVDFSFYERFKKEANSPSGKCASQLLTKVENFIQSGNFYFWDPLAAAIAANETLAQFQDAHVEIINEEGDKCGQTFLTELGIKVHIVKEINTADFIEDFISVFRVQ